MDSELSIIDGIVNNLAGIQSFYEFEYQNLSGLVNLLKKFQEETGKAEEVEKSNEIFKKETSKEIAELEKRLQHVSQKVEQMKIDINVRVESKQKLMNLFQSLMSVDSLNQPSEVKSLEASKPTKILKDIDDETLPIMEIREELDESGKIINSELKPYQSQEEQLKELLEKSARKLPGENTVRAVKKDNNQLMKKATSKLVSALATVPEPHPQILEENDDEEDEDNFRPFVIREEIDENGNTVKTSMARIPQMKPTKEEAQKISEVKGGEEGDINENQLNELFEDMGFKVSKEGSNLNIKEEVERKANSIVEVKKIDPEISKKYNIDTEELYTLELLADKINQGDADEDNGVEGDQELFIDDIEDYEWPVIDAAGDDDDDTDSDEGEEDEEVQKKTMINMFGTRGQHMFANKLMDLRNRKNSDVEDVIVEQVNDVVDKAAEYEMIQKIEEVLEEAKDTGRKKKSVSFNRTVNIKKVPDIWDDLRQSNYENEIKAVETPNIAKKEHKKSLFKRSVGTKGEQKPNNNDIIEKYTISDVVERQVVDASTKNISHHNVFKIFDNKSVRKQVDANMVDVVEKQNMTKLVGKKSPSRFKLARAAEQGKKFQETHVPTEVREELQALVVGMQKQTGRKKKKPKYELKKNLQSLRPLNKAGKGVNIETPKDINPLPVNPTSLKEEDYEIIRNEVNECLFDDDEEMVETEFVSSQNIIEPEIRGDEGIKENFDGVEFINPNYFPKYEGKKVTEPTSVVGTTLDYKTLGDDLDTMAKAYVLGLYDDDMETNGEVIEKLDDFEQHNKIVEEREGHKLHDRVEEINRESLGEALEPELDVADTMVMSDIVENDMDGILEANAVPDDDLDIELNDDTLTTQVALGYTKMRANMIYKYNGGFRETEKEKEFVRPEGSERVSRFKMARLGI